MVNCLSSCYYWDISFDHDLSVGQEEIVPKTNVIMALAKVMIAAAWADGSVNNDEINSLKDLLFQLPEMTDSDLKPI